MPNNQSRQNPQMDPSLIMRSVKSVATHKGSHNSLTLSQARIKAKRLHGHTYSLYRCRSP